MRSLSICALAYPPILTNSSSPIIDPLHVFHEVQTIPRRTAQPAFYEKQDQNVMQMVELKMILKRREALSLELEG